MNRGRAVLSREAERSQKVPSIYAGGWDYGKDSTFFPPPFEYLKKKNIRRPRRLPNVPVQDGATFFFLSSLAPAAFLSLFSPNRFDCRHSGKERGKKGRSGGKKKPTRKQLINPLRGASFASPSPPSLILFLSHSLTSF